ncbi:MAG: TraB/GumN family protein [Sphingomonas sp.]|nr:TraB/GumN family protein [Sphingomonas sp.]
MIKLLQRFIAPVTALLALGSAAQARAPQTARPALWAVSDPDTTVYLFGTIHLLPSDLKWRTAKLDQAMANSQQLMVETIIDEKNPTKLMSALASIGLAKGLPPLIERVPPAKRPALAAAIKKSGVPEKAFNGMKTWMAAFLLLSNQFKELGLSGGVEGVLRNDFLAHNKPIGELETNLEQLTYFDKLPEAAQLNLLDGAIEETSSMKQEFGGMLGAWSRGDVKGIAKTFDRDLANSPELRDNLIRQRNANWARWIEKRMAQPGAVLVAVGAGHLAGPYSVIEALKKDGYAVRRVE